MFSKARKEQNRKVSYFTIHYYYRDHCPEEKNKGGGRKFRKSVVVQQLLDILVLQPRSGGRVVLAADLLVVDLAADSVVDLAGGFSEVARVEVLVTDS
jgi:hypothetical protein